MAPPDVMPQIPILNLQNLIKGRKAIYSFLSLYHYISIALEGVIDHELSLALYPLSELRWRYGILLRDFDVWVAINPNSHVNAFIVWTFGHPPILSINNNYNNLIHHIGHLAGTYYRYGIGLAIVDNHNSKTRKPKSHREVSERHQHQQVSTIPPPLSLIHSSPRNYLSSAQDGQNYQ